MSPRPPDFIGIGAQKAGTWWLRINLANHPRVWMPPKPELHYFDRFIEGLDLPHESAITRLSDIAHLRDSLKEIRQLARAGDIDGLTWRAIYEFLDHDDDWYRLLFASAPEGSITGEITPRYAILEDEQIAHMHDIAPAAKIVFLLRNPVERFWSQCKMRYRAGTMPLGDPAAMQLFESANGKPRGEYTKTIVRYCRQYDPSQVLIVFQDAISRQPHQVLRGIFGFLGIGDCCMDESTVGIKFNAAVDSRPIPDSLRPRIEAAYRTEMETLAEVIGGYAATWLDHSESLESPPVMQLTRAHLDAIEARSVRIRSARKCPPAKVFCLSMQRSGTTSVGDWLEAHGLVRAGSPTSLKHGWTRLWYEGRYEEIFTSDRFQAAEVLEDDPWWCPGFHRYLAARFSDAKFILLTRDPDIWFDSLCHHSGGMNPGWTDIHARLYGREPELQALLCDQPTTDPAEWGLLSIIEHRDHYKQAYVQHSAEVRATFAAAPERLYCGNLDDARSFREICEFIGVSVNPEITIPRSNARTDEMASALAKLQRRKSL